MFSLFSYFLISVFKKLSYLQQHERYSHTELKEFKCVHCPESFYTISLRTKHMIKRHKLPSFSNKQWVFCLECQIFSKDVVYKVSGLIHQCLYCFNYYLCLPQNFSYNALLFKTCPTKCHLLFTACCKINRIKCFVQIIRIGGQSCIHPMMSTMHFYYESTCRKFF